MKKTAFIICVLLLAVTVSAQQDKKEISNFDGLNQYLLQKISADEFSGVVLIAKDGKPVFEKAYGYACKRYDVKNKIDTKFNIGSISKHLTGIAILQLAE